ncbi:MAG TPA: hypothetical protein VHV26_04270 [Rhizomicrobium sp.]|nr:hypothetical protein [Rhizomicrobium sp.]
MERAPWYVIYAFHLPYCVLLALRYGGLALPSIANPGLDASGLTKESKNDLFALLGPSGRMRLPSFMAIDSGPEALALAERAMLAAELGFPVVVKPDIGRRGFGVKIVRTPQDLAAHLAKFSLGVRLLIQRFATGSKEAGLFYVRMPSETRGRIVSLTLKHFPEVVGDGTSTVRELILQNSRARVFSALYFRRNHDVLDRVLERGERYPIVSLGNHVRGSAFTDESPQITPAMEEVFDKIAREIPGFFIGRFDVRFESLEALQRGEGFEIVEYNGASGEPTHMWDARTSVAATYAGLFQHLRFLYAIGAENRARGAQPLSVWTIIKRHFEELRLLQSYPDEE